LSSIIYCDSSILVSYALRDEKRFREINQLIDSDALVVTSELSLVEATAGVISQLQAREAEKSDIAIQNLNTVFQYCQMLKISRIVLGEARKLVMRYRISKGLRSADSIHVASWNLYTSQLTEEDRIQLSFLTSDKKQFSAFTSEGHAGKFIG
jgi:predicted nucleic acid-binding protein